MKVVLEALARFVDRLDAEDVCRIIFVSGISLAFVIAVWSGIAFTFK